MVKRKKIKVILLYVASLDGKVTKWGQSNISKWTSQEDAAYFREVLHANKIIVMGSNTYEAVKPTPTKGTLRVILTKQTRKYAKFAIPGQLEFMDETPERLVHGAEEKGYNKMLLVSGGKLTTSFFQKNLIDEIWLTIEPKIFGSGDQMIKDEKFDISLQLLSVKKLNVDGTLLIKYKIVK